MKLLKSTLFIALISLALFIPMVVPATAGEPVTVTVASAAALCSSTDSTTVKTYAVDLLANGIDISQPVTAYWTVSSAKGAVNASIYYKKAPVNSASYLATADTIMAYASRTTETVLNDTVKVSTYPIGRYVFFYVDPNIGAGVTGRSDSALTLYIVGHRRAYTGKY